MTEYNDQEAFEEIVASARRAPLSIMDLALTTAFELDNAGYDSPRLGVLYGPAGLGKTNAASFVTGRVNGCYVRAKSISTVKSFLTDIAIELGLARPAKTGPALLSQLIQHLTSHPEMLLIDEMDYLVKRQMVDVIRDLHDNTPIPIMLIGMEELPARLEEWPQFHSRILKFAPAQAATDVDAKLLRDVYCQRVKVDDDLVEHFRQRTAGNVRRIQTNLEAAQTFGINEQLERVTLAHWQGHGRTVMTGDAPLAKRKAA